MPGMGLETSLVELGSALLGILLRLVLVAIVAGVLTLPLFYGVLAVMVSWFWASEVKEGSRVRRVFAALLRVGLPLFSLNATILSLGYFGAFDWPGRMLGEVKGYKPGPATTVFRDGYAGYLYSKHEYPVPPAPSWWLPDCGFDGVTRKAGTLAAPALPQDVKIDWTDCPNAARELVKLNADELKPPPPPPFEKMFPPTDAGGPPGGFGGPPPTPPAVTVRVADLIRKALDGSIYANETPGGLTKEEARAADDVYDRAVKDSKAAQDGTVQRIRGFSLFLLLLVGPLPLTVFAASFVFGRRGVVLVLRSLVRSLLRTSLTYLAVFVLVFIFSSVESVLDFLSELTVQKDQNLKGIVTEKYQIPSQMKPSHLQGIKDMINALPDGERPDDVEGNIMTWAFVGGTLDPNKRTFQNSLFFFATEPEKVLKMMPGLEDLTGEQLDLLKRATAEMERDPKAVVIGAERLRQLGKRVGDRMKVTSLNYAGIEFDFVIIAEFPAGSRWEQSAVMNRRYLDNELDAYKGRNGKEHDLADKCMNLIWVRLPNPKAFDDLSEKLSDPGKFSPAIKMEIESSAYANFLSPYKTLISFMRYALAPGLLIITTLVASLVIGIGVRERRTEIAVLKVLGFRPWMVLGLVLGEALLIGTLSGFMATATAYSLVNAMGGIPLPIGFFGKFFIPESALWWGPAIGGLTSLVGSILPSATAYKIKASQVFSRVT
jgi:putative ABC transport system permease protein